MFNHWQRFACFTNYSLLDQTSARWTVIHSCRRLHKIPAHTFKELRNRPQRLLPSARRFRPSEPPIIAGFSASSTPRFEVDSAASTPTPKGLSSKRAAYYVRLFVSVNTSMRATSTSFLAANRGRRRGSESMRPVCGFGKRRKHTSRIHAPLRPEHGPRPHPPGFAVSMTTPSSLPASATLTRLPSLRAIR